LHSDEFNGGAEMKRIIRLTVSAIIISVMVFNSAFAAVSGGNSSTGAAVFKDVKSGDWFEEAVNKLNKMKIVDGLPGGSFNPQGQVTRAQFVKMLVQALEYKKIDSVSFDDLKPFAASKPHWACVYIETALRNGVIVKDETGSNFYPDVPLTRKDMGMMMFRALKLSPSDGDNPFADIKEANGAFTKLYEQYLIRGTIEGGKRLYRPEGLTTRAEAAVIIARMLEYKENPEKFVAKAAMEERFRNGTQTEEDVALKRKLEIEKAIADPNYIMEPMIRILNTREDFDGWGERADRAFILDAGYIALDNYEDYAKYSSDIQFKVVCTDKNKDLINTGTLLTQPFISYDHVYEVRRDVWEPMKIAYNQYLDTYILFYITRDEEKAVMGKWTKVSDYVKKGETLTFKLYLKRGINTKEYVIKFMVN